MKSTLSYLGQVVKDHDPDRFFLSLFAPVEAREDLWALAAFNHEIAKTREVVSETMLGLMRLQWWREEIGKIYDTGVAPENEVLQGLAKAIKKHALPREEFETLIYAREFDLENVLPANMDGLLNYADFTSAPLMKLSVQVLGRDPEFEPAQPVAMNYALCGLLRAVPFHATQRRCYMPEDLMKQYGVTLTQLYDFLKPEPGLKDVAREVAGHFIWDLRPKMKYLAATQALAKIYMRKIKRTDYDVFNAAMALPPYFKELRVFAAQLGK